MSEQAYIPTTDDLGPDQFRAHPDPARWLAYWVMSRAVDRFGGRADLMFNTACFQREWRNMAGIGSWLHAFEVREMLLRLECAEHLPGGAHWQMKPFAVRRGPSIFARPPADAPRRAIGIA